VPNLIPGDSCRFLISPVPSVVIPAEAEGVSDLPPLAFYDGGAPVRLADWTALARPTMCVLDGPGDAGVLIPTISEQGQLAERMEWADAVAGAGGVLVLQAPAELMDTHLLELVSRADVRGGFVPHIA